jgi:hypothetical protein
MTDSKKQDSVNFPDTSAVINRIANFPVHDWISSNPLKDPEFEELERIRLSRVCLHDAAEDIRGAGYALKQAVDVKNDYLAQTDSEQSNRELVALAYYFGRFYADYVPLLLYSSAKDALDAIYYLFNWETKNETGKALKWLLGDYRNFLPTTFVEALSTFEKSRGREHVWTYRNGWVHNKAPRIETPLYDPPRDAGIRQIGPWRMAGFGLTVKPRYRWSEWIDALAQALSDTVALLNACADVWEAGFNEYQEE